MALQPGTRVEETVFTRKENGGIELRSDRPFLLLSSTSWTGKIAEFLIEIWANFVYRGRGFLHTTKCNRK